MAAVAAVLGAALLLRGWRLGFGLPFSPGVDEPEIMDRVVRMMRTGDFNPHFFDWPTLTFYAQLAVACVSFLAGAMRGLWNNLNQIAPTDLYVPARLLTALTGTATVGVLYAAGRRFGGAEALLAAALLAVLPNHVRESHYVLADVPAAFFTTLALLLSLRASERGTLGSFAWAGLTVGLAASSKYNGLIAIVLPLIAAAERPRGWSTLAQRVSVVAIAALAGFLAGTPYALLDLPHFLNRYARLAAIFAQERAGEPGWLLYLKYLRDGLGWPALALGCAGLAITAWRSLRGPARVRWLLACVFPLIYFKVMAGSFQIYGRYLMPLLPAAALLSAIAAVRLGAWLAARLRDRRVAVAAFAVVIAVVLAPPAWTSVRFDASLSRPWTTDEAYAWLQSNVPPGSRLVVETRILRLAPPRYRATNVASLLEQRYEDYAAAGVNYLIASSQMYGAAFANPAAHPQAYTAYQTLFAQATEVASFRASEQVPGPTLRIFRITPAATAAPAR